jgi:hypothetical protein
MSRHIRLEVFGGVSPTTRQSHQPQQIHGTGSDLRLYPAPQRSSEKCRETLAPSSGETYGYHYI